MGSVNGGHYLNITFLVPLREAAVLPVFATIIVPFPSIYTSLYSHYLTLTMMVDLDG